MYCKYCGKEMPADARFCAGCGASAQPRSPSSAQGAPQRVTSQPAATGQRRRVHRSKGRLGSFFLGILAAAILFAGGVFAYTQLAAAPAQVQPREGDGFETPEDAVLAYVEALQNQDINAMLQTFAIESYVEHLDWQAYVQRLQIYSFPSTPPPADPPLFSDYSCVWRADSIAQQILMQVMTLCAPDSPVLDFRPIMLDLDVEKPADFQQRLFPNEMLEPLASLTTGDFLPPETVAPEIEIEKFQESFQSYRQALGANELRDMALELQLNGVDYLFCPQAVRYGDRWYLCSLHGNVAVLLGVAFYAGGLWVIQ